MILVFGAGSPSQGRAHRRHHQVADEEQDPHSPLRSFFWAHMGWLLVKIDDGPLIERYAKDIARDPFYRWLDQRNNWLIVALASWIAYFSVGFAAAALSASARTAPWRSPGVGAILRTVVVWHLTWSVNSVTHVWGYRNYETPDVSRNNAIIAILVSGEGWHNNHHADQRSARHGHKWWELDLTWLVIRFLMFLGLAKDVALPSSTLDAKFRDPR
jgi:stearoyl-CoA desaturase (delta-9 desaturase)